jgi:hypothetical protein
MREQNKRNTRLDLAQKHFSLKTQKKNGDRRLQLLQQPRAARANRAQDTCISCDALARRHIPAALLG